MESSRFTGPKYLLIASVSLVPLIFSSGAFSQQEKQVRDIALKLLGKHIFYDTELSNPKGNQACVSCHEPFAGGTSGFSDVNATIVAVPGANFENLADAIGGRKPPTNAYASFAPPWSSSCGTLISNFCGGNFWDGRSQGIPHDSTDGSNPAPHLDQEVFYNIENTNILAFSKYFGPTSDQALNPMPNPVEQNVAEVDVCKRVAASEYRNLYKVAFGKDINCSYTLATSDEHQGYPQYEISFRRMMLAVGAYQHSWDINSFTSKRDLALRSELACIENGHEEFYDAEFCAEVQEKISNVEDPKSQYGKFPLAMLTDVENFGHDIFYNIPHGFIPGLKSNPNPDIPAGACAFCHSDNPTNPFVPVFPFFVRGDDGSEPLQIYTDQAFHNIGVPKNPQIANSAVEDTGLQKILPVDGRDAFITPKGGFRTPTLRNLSKGASDNFTKAYMHNGFFKSLERVVHFYNTRDNLGFCPTPLDPSVLTDEYAKEHNCWPLPEFNNRSDLSRAGIPGSITQQPLIGSLGLTPSDEGALVAYLKTLSDYHTSEPPLIFERRAFLPARIAINGNYRPRMASPATVLFSYEGDWLIRECNKHYLGDGVTPISVTPGTGCSMESIIQVLQYLH